MKHRRAWQWFVWGKHPGVEDFICAGTQTPLFHRFTKWVDTGFARVTGDPSLRSRHLSWRFWAHGTGDDIVCGLVRNSCDRYGRSFPQLYMGSGNLDGWKINCSLLPFAFEPVWKQFEYVGSARYHSVKRLNDALQLMQPPGPAWHRYRQRVYREANLNSIAGFDEEVNGENRIYRIECNFPENLPHDLNFCNRVMPQGDSKPPNAVFIGEIGTRIAVAVVNTILVPTDFNWLWSLCEKADTANKRNP